MDCCWNHPSHHPSLPHFETNLIFWAVLPQAKLHILGDSAYSAWDHIDDYDFCHVDQVDLRFCGVNGMCRSYP